jgi:hypothetical protein
VIGGMFIGHITLKITSRIGRTYDIYLLRKYKLLPGFIPMLIATYHGYKIKAHTVKKLGR